MKVMTVFGSRSETIKLSLILKVLDQHSEHLTIQIVSNSERGICDELFHDLEIKQPDMQLIAEPFPQAEMMAHILPQIKKIVGEFKPDRILVIGGGAAAFAGSSARGKQVAVFHLEAGKRCFDKNIAEEDCRISVDHTCSVLLPYTSRTMGNLVQEGIETRRVFVTGNPIREVHDTFNDRIESSEILKALDVKPFDYFLATTHRAENVDDKERMAKVFNGVAAVAAKFGKTVLVVAHSRTADKLEQHAVRPNSHKIRLLKTLKFFDFVKLEKNSLAVLTDSGTVQDECCILGIPNVTLRDVTDRPETIDCGSNILSGVEPDAIVRAVEIAIAQPAAWTPPFGYLVSNVSQSVSRIVLGHLSSPKQDSEQSTI